MATKKTQTTIEADAPRTTQGATEQSNTGDKMVRFSGSALAETNVPEYLRQQVGNHEGMEGVDRDDQIIPRLAIAQTGMSPQLKKHSEQFIPGLEPGQLFNTVSNEIYGDKVCLVPLMFFKQYIKFTPMDQGGGVVAMYDRKEDVPAADLAWVADAKPLVTEFKNRLCMLIRPDHKPELIVASFKSSGLKCAKKWNSLIASTNLPAYARSYVLEVKTKIDGNKSWFVTDVTPDQFVPQEFFVEAKAMFDAMSKGGFKVDTTGLEQEREPGSDDNTQF